MNNEFKRKIRKDLLRSGVGAELQTLRAFRAANWSVTGASYFLDRDETKTREVDLVASRTLESKLPLIEGGGGAGKRSWLSYSFFLAGEVKKSKHPWVVLRERVDQGGLYEGWLNLIHAFNLPVENAELAKELDATSIARTDGRFGVGIHEAFKHPDSASRWYSAAVTSCKAAEHVLTYHSPTRPVGRSSFDPSESVEFILVKPIVVVDGELLAVEAGSGEEALISEIDWATLRFQFRSPGYDRGHYFPDCVKLSALDRYLEIVSARWRSLLRVIGSGLPHFELADYESVL